MTGFKNRKIRLLVSLYCCLMFQVISAGYPVYKPIDKDELKRINELKADGSYLDEYYTAKIKKSNVHSVLEIGSRDAEDAVKLSEFYKSHVYAFECNPSALSDCRKSIDKNPNVTLIPKAAWHESGEISFYPIRQIPGYWYNPGASSCFKVSKTGYHGCYAQDEVKVEAVRLDNWLEKAGITQIDLLCIDAQGATMNIFKGMGKYLNGVKYIITEIEHNTIYEGETLRDEVNSFLEKNGFKMYLGKVNRFFGDYLYIRNDLITD
jgi:FkbM family methyltransferase